MTYCLGWTTEACAYLVADTATTSPRPLSMLRSSFGERHASDASGNVQEAALKIISAPGAGITFAGSASLGRAVAETFRMALTTGVAAAPALQSAISSNIGSGSAVDLSLLCAFVQDGKPHLMSFNRDHDQRLVEHAPGELVQLGCLVGKEESLIRQISDAFLCDLSKANIGDSMLLACALGLCQSYGVHHGILQQGAGGAFTGAFVNGGGFHWQPDVGYMLLIPDESDSEGDGVFPFIRDDVLVVRSLLSDGPPRILITSLGESLEAVRKRGDNVDRQCLIALRNMQFDYLVFLNTAKPVVTVVEMGRRLEHRYVKLHPWSPASSEGKSRMHIAVGAPLSLMMEGTHVTDAQKLDPDVPLGAMLNYVNFVDPRFDINYVGFDVKFFDGEGEAIELLEETLEQYRKYNDMAPIFVQRHDEVGFGSAHLLKLYLDVHENTIEDYIPIQERRPEGSKFQIPFALRFTRGSFYMRTKSGQRDISELVLVLEITWLPTDASSPRHHEGAVPGTVADRSPDPSGSPPEDATA